MRAQQLPVKGIVLPLRPLLKSDAWEWESEELRKPELFQDILHQLILHFQFDPVIFPMPCAPIDPSQQLLEYVLSSQHKQARELP